TSTTARPGKPAKAGFPAFPGRRGCPSPVPHTSCLLARIAPRDPRGHASRMPDSTSRPSPPPPGSVLRPVERWRGGECRRLDDHVAEEVPVAFVYNNAPFAVMMATPADLEDFATGFAISEGIVERPGDAVVERVEELLEGIEIRLRIPAARAEALALRRRSMSGRSGCGVCCSELLEAVLRYPPPVASDVRVSPAALRRALADLRAAQR